MAVGMAAAVIGCGGGGAGGSRAAGDGGGAIATTGTLTTGGTTGAPATTGAGGDPVVDPTTGGTGDPTTGSDGATTGGVPDPSTGGHADPTTGSGTTSGATDVTTGSTGTVDPTTGGATGTTTGLGTTGSATGGTDGSTTASGDPTTGGTGTTGTTGSATTGGVPDPYPGGYLRPNAVYFAHTGDPSLVSSVLPDGTDRQDAGGLGADVLAAVPDPDAPGRYVYAALVNGLYGVYRGTTFDPGLSETLAAPAFGYVTTLQATAHGDAIVVADRGLYLLTNGEVRLIAPADAAAVSVDGARVAFTNGTPSGIYCYERASGATRALVSGGDSLLPSFSRDGAYILFSSNRDDPNGATYDLYQVPSSGGTLERMTNTPDVDELGGSYNSARTMVAYVAIGADPDRTGLFVLSNGGAYRIAPDADLAYATYWTDPSGRSRAARRGGRFQRLPALAKHKPSLKRRRR